MILNMCDKSQQSELGYVPGRQHVSRPKSLAERLQWMSENLPGFREELAVVNEAEQRARARAAIPKLVDVRQRDFWPELKSPAMTFYAGAANTATNRLNTSEASE